MKKLSQLAILGFSSLYLSTALANVPVSPGKSDDYRSFKGSHHYQNEGYHHSKKKKKRHYTVYQGMGFPPFDTSEDGITPAGFSYDLFKAACDANKRMKCTVEVRPYSDCLVTDSSQPFSIGIGPGLARHDVVACLTWAKTQVRVDRGLVFTDLKFEDRSDQDAKVYSTVGVRTPNVSGDLYTTSGFFANQSCVESELNIQYSGSVAEATTAEAVAEAQAAGDDVVILDFDPVNRDGLTLISSIRCSAGTTVITYPPSNKKLTAQFLEDFNCGLHLIAENGKYLEICAQYGNPASCRPALSFIAPSKECKKLDK